MNEIYLKTLYRLNIDFAENFAINERVKKMSKKELINTSTRVFDGKKYESLYIIEPRVVYLTPLPEKFQDNLFYMQNLIGEFGIILQILEKYILLYNASENLVYLNKNLCICNIKKI